MLTRPHCQQCAMMHKVLGDRVETALAGDRPDLLEKTGIQTVPQYVVLDGDAYVGAFAGMMPVSLWERRVAAYKGV